MREKIRVRERFWKYCRVSWCTASRCVRMRVQVDLKGVSGQLLYYFLCLYLGLRWHRVLLQVNLCVFPQVRWNFSRINFVIDIVYLYKSSEITSAASVPTLKYSSTLLLIKIAYIRIVFGTVQKKFVPLWSSSLVFEFEKLKFS